MNAHSVSRLDTVDSPPPPSIRNTMEAAVRKIGLFILSKFRKYRIECQVLYAANITQLDHPIKKTLFRYLNDSLEAIFGRQCHIRFHTMAY
ncbi:hypothetical protein TNIN_136831 [Trichonephila inaurata madagascariensis]|uniref:Uncharacterized protein n=1 Tax=Trichonephila inaurata madagascariensis TaxID=2747483 RepID=A0A8X6XRV4_9ARAC|nr:hypothetical protein TNIN_136831 [Trichonephila inaurata madagascariensis]